MEITTTTMHDLKWDFPGANEFNATITNGKITKLHFMDVGDLTERDLSSTNEKYLRNVHKALSGLFQHLDEIRALGSAQLEGEEHEEKEHVLTKFNEKMKSIAYAQANAFEKKVLLIK